MPYSRCVNSWKPEPCHTSRSAPGRSGRTETRPAQLLRPAARAGIFRLILHACAGGFCLVCPVSAGDPPLPMYATACLLAGPLEPIKVNRDEQGKNTLSGLLNWIWDYGPVNIPKGPGPLLLTVLFPATGETAGKDHAESSCRWSLTLNGTPGLSVRGNRSAFSGTGIAADVSGLRNQSVSIIIKVELTSAPPDTPAAANLPDPVLLLIRLTPAAEALPGACLGLACFRLTGDRDYSVTVHRTPEVALSLGCAAGETWLIRPFRRLADITLPETGEGGSLRNRWIAQWDNPDAFAFLSENHVREP